MALFRRVAFLCAVGMPILTAGLSAQQTPAPAAAQTPSDIGKKLFVQRCSVCHLPPLGPGEPRAYARSLAGLVKTREAEAAARQVIQKGIPSRMPGFQFGLEPNQIDQIVAYLSTLK